MDRKNKIMKIFEEETNYYTLLELLKDDFSIIYLTKKDAELLFVPFSTFLEMNGKINSLTTQNIEIKDLISENMKETRELSCSIAKLSNFSQEFTDYQKECNKTRLGKIESFVKKNIFKIDEPVANFIRIFMVLFIINICITLFGGKIINRFYIDNNLSVLMINSFVGLFFTKYFGKK